MVFLAVLGWCFVWLVVSCVCVAIFGWVLGFRGLVGSGFRFSLVL